MLYSEEVNHTTAMTIPTDLITRADYMARYSPLSDVERSALHRAYYAQFVTAAHFARLQRRVGMIEKIKKSQCPHFNNIPLSTWDLLALPLPAESVAAMKACGDYPTLAGAVCTLKEAAEQIRESK
jgi:hypothetical protein